MKIENEKNFTISFWCAEQTTEIDMFYEDNPYLQVF